jgi:hypothetical protein
MKRSNTIENDVYDKILSMLVATDAINTLTNNSSKMRGKVSAVLAAGF